MGCCKASVPIEMSTAKVEASFRVTTCVRALDWPGCNKVRQVVNRENIYSARVNGLDQIFDRVDAIISGTSLTYLIWLLIPLVGAAVTLALVFTDNINNIWMGWVFPQSLIQPLHGYYWWKRRKDLRRALLEWNRDVGASQGVSLQFGVDSFITDYRQFEGAASCGHCSCCRHEANLQLCTAAPDQWV